jgi:predicted Fe-Mo cluster-binding NifX family protein
MIGILKNWFELIPSNADLVVQQGASLVLENRTTLYTFKDKGILVYAGDDGVRSVEDVIAKALS